MIVARLIDPHSKLATARALGLESQSGTRVRAPVFLCMLAYYVEWHMREALAPILSTGSLKGHKA